jgi:hypothetical protein
MKKNRTAITIVLVVMTIVLLGTTVYISSLLSSTSSPTQIQKTKAAAVTYTRKVDLFPTPETGGDIPTVSPPALETPTPGPTTKAAAIPTKAPLPTLLALAPTLVPTIVPTKTAVSPTSVPTPTILPATPTLQPLLAYKSTSISPTLIPMSNTGGMIDPTKAPTKTPSPTSKIVPTGVQQLPETGWIQTSSILFIVATSTILFSLLF